MKKIEFEYLLIKSHTENFFKLKRNDIYLQCPFNKHEMHCGSWCPSFK